MRRTDQTTTDRDWLRDLKWMFTQQADAIERHGCPGMDYAEAQRFAEELRSKAALAGMPMPPGEAA